MSAFTTGELAKACQVSVRTVQYYDQRGILRPSAFSQGGRRLYDEKDLQRLKLICFLRDLDFSIEQIRTILDEDNRSKVLTVILDQQIKDLREEVDKKRQKLDSLVNLSKDLSLWEDLSEDSLTDVTIKMRTNQKQRHLYVLMISLGMFGNVLLWGSLWLSFVWGSIFPAIIGFLLSSVYVSFLVRYFYRQVAYICPECHQIFRPPFKSFFLASHTPRTRKLT
uniref:MerR family transcriptional regulator n=1 Tax=Streptococcus ferus TaxID=1345 RepID=UPI0035A1875E